MSSKRNYKKICLTGGPCSGKTSALTAIKHQFSQHFTVFECPEVGTLAFLAGVNLVPTAYTKEEHKIFTHAICKAQMDLETYFESIAYLQKGPVLIVTDRGVSDNFAYTDPENKQKILEENKWSMNYIRNDRYDLVIYLVTAASGAQEFYTQANNQARSESPEEAIAIDDRNALEYISHPNMRVIDNTDKGFGEKLARVLRTIDAFVELMPENFNFEKMHHHNEHHHFKEVLTRLLPNDQRIAVWWVCEKFNHFNKEPMFESIIQKVEEGDPNMFVESHQSITKEEYEAHLQKADSHFKPMEREGISHLFKIEQEHNIISLGKVTVGEGKARYILRLIRDTKHNVATKLPDYAEGATVIIKDLFETLKELGK